MSYVIKSGSNEIECKKYENVIIIRSKHKCDLPNPGWEAEGGGGGYAEELIVRSTIWQAFRRYETLTV